MILMILCPFPIPPNTLFGVSCQDMFLDKWLPSFFPGWWYTTLKNHECGDWMKWNSKLNETKYVPNNQWVVKIVAEKLGLNHNLMDISWYFTIFLHSQQTAPKATMEKGKHYISRRWHDNINMGPKSMVVFRIKIGMPKLSHIVNGHFRHRFIGVANQLLRPIYGPNTGTCSQNMDV